MKFALCNEMFLRWSLENQFDAFAAWGYDGAELSAIQGMCEHLVLDAWETQAPLVKAAAMEAVWSCCPWRSPRWMRPV